MTASGLGARRDSASAAAVAAGAGSQRPLLVTGALGAAAVTVFGLAVITVLVLAGWITAPHSPGGLPGVLRTAAALWLVGNHVGFTLRGTGRIGLLPLGLLLLPGFLLWRAGRWVVRAGQVRRLRNVGYATLALAVPYAVLTCALALASRSARESSSLPLAFACGLLLPLVAGGLGVPPGHWRHGHSWRPCCRSGRGRSCSAAQARWRRCSPLAACWQARRWPCIWPRQRGWSEASHRALSARSCCCCSNSATCRTRSAGPSAFSLGPGFAFGASTVVAPAGSALTQLPAFPLLAALPPGLHAAHAWLAGADGPGDCHTWPGLPAGCCCRGRRPACHWTPRHCGDLPAACAAASWSGCSRRSRAVRLATPGSPRSARPAGKRPLSGRLNSAYRPLSAPVRPTTWGYGAMACSGRRAMAPPRLALLRRSVLPRRPVLCRRCRPGRPPTRPMPGTLSTSIRGRVIGRARPAVGSPRVRRSAVRATTRCPGWQTQVQTASIRCSHERR